nr:hypothetical protein [Tanacetum cinerariifolium]
PPNINHCCYECGDPLDGIFCKRCTCKYCGKDAHIGYNFPLKVPVISNPEPCNNQTIDELPQTLPIFHLTFHSEAESAFTLDSTPTYVNESPNVFNPPPQPPVYPCEFYGNDAYYGHYCTPQAPFIYPEPCYNQDFNFWQDFQNVPQQYPCCDDCGVTHEVHQTGNSFTYDTIPKSFDEVQIIPNPPSQCHFNIYLCQICESNSHYGYECSQRVPLVYEPEPCYIQNLSDNDYSHDLPSVNPLIDHHCCYKCGYSLNDFFCHLCTCEFCGNGAHVGYNCPTQVPSFQTLPNFPQQYPCCEDCRGLPEADHYQPPQYTVNHSIFNAQNGLLNSQNKLMEQLTSLCEMIHACCDDDDDYNFAITPNEPVNSLSMGDEHLNTILATKSDEFIKSSVENLVPNPSESEGENECDVPACFTTFSNILFDVVYDFDSSDDQSLSDEDFPKEIYSNHLFDEEIISMKINPHHFNAESDLIESLLNRIDKTDCYPEEEIRLTKRLLYDNSSPRPPKEFVFENSNVDIESFSPSPIPVEDSDSFMEETDLSFTPDDPMPSGIEEDDYDSERDIPIREELLENYSLSLPVIESYHFDIPSFSHPPAKPPDGNTGILNIKMMGDIFEQKPSVECPMIHGKDTPILDVPLFYFYPLDQFKYELSNIPENMKTLAKGYYSLSLHFPSFIRESCIQI